MTAPDPRAWLDQVDARTNAATDIIEARVPSDAVVTIATMDSQREGSSWRATVAWREGR